MLDVVLVFTGLDHGKALVYEHCKRLLVNLIIILVCHGNYINIAQPLSDFMAASEQGLGKYGLQKSLWTLDIGSMVRVPDNSQSSAGVGSENQSEQTQRKDSKHSTETEPVK